MIKTLSYEVKHMNRTGFGFQTWKFHKPPKSFILQWLRRIQAYLFHFQFLNLFKSWSNLGFDQDSNGYINSKKNGKKPKNIVFWCHIVSIQVDKQGLDIFKPNKSCIYPLTLNSALWSQAWREVLLGFKHGNFTNLPNASFYSD